MNYWNTTVDPGGESMIQALTNDNELTWDEKEIVRVTPPFIPISHRWWMQRRLDGQTTFWFFCICLNLN